MSSPLQRSILSPVLSPALSYAPNITDRASERTPDRTRGIPGGRLVELVSGVGPSSGSSLAALTLLETQKEGGLTAWIEHEGGALYPPDLAQLGLDLDSLLIVRTPTEGGAIAIAKAAEILLRTGAFSALTLDLSGLKRPRGEAFLARLAALAREYGARVLILRDSSEEPSLGTSIALRLDARRIRVGRGRFRLEAHALKNKLGQPPPRLFRIFSAPEGVW